MKIDIDKRPTTKFSSVKMGECFSIADCLYIKIHGGTPKAVSLSSGFIELFADNTQVNIAKVKIVEDV